MSEISQVEQGQSVEFLKDKFRNLEIFAAAGRKPEELVAAMNDGGNRIVFMIVNEKKFILSLGFHRHLEDYAGAIDKTKPVILGEINMGDNGELHLDTHDHLAKNYHLRTDQAIAVDKILLLKVREYLDI